MFFFYFSKPKLDVILNPLYQPDDQPLGENPQSIDRKNVVYKEVNDDLQNAIKVQPGQQQRSLSDTNVYNRLHEPDQEDRSDYYDHAEPTPSKDGYGSLFVEDDGNDNYSAVDRAEYSDYGNTMTVGNKQNNSYSTLSAEK